MNQKSNKLLRLLINCIQVVSFTFAAESIPENKDLQTYGTTEARLHWYLWFLFKIFWEMLTMIYNSGSQSGGKGTPKGPGRKKGVCFHSISIH